MIHEFKQPRPIGKVAQYDTAQLGIDLNEIEPIDDFSPGTLLKLSRRIERSVDYEQLVYREIELDEVWRLIDCALAEAHRTGADSAELSRLETLRAGTIQAHDLLENPASVRRAADRLMEIVS